MIDRFRYYVCIDIFSLFILLFFFFVQLWICKFSFELDVDAPLKSQTLTKFDFFERYIWPIPVTIESSIITQVPLNQFVNSYTEEFLLLDEVLLLFFSLVW